MRLTFGFTFLLILTTACMSVSALHNSPSVPSDRMILHSGQNEKNRSQLTIIRDGSLIGSACYYAIYIDDKLAARIGKAEKVTFFLEPGEQKQYRHECEAHSSGA